MEEEIQKPFYRRRGFIPAVLTIALSLFTVIFVSIDIRRDERQQSAERSSRRNYRNELSIEEQRRMGMIPRVRDTITYCPPTDIHKRVEEAIKEGAIDNFLINKLSEVDYHDILDYMGGPEGF